MNPAGVNMANMAAMGAMGGPVGVGAPMPAMNNGPVVPPQLGARAPTNEQHQQRTLLNTYIYEYFIRFDMFDCARAMVTGNHQVNVVKNDPNRRQGENGNLLGNGVGDDAMDTDSKDDIEGKLPDDLPAPKLPQTSDGTSFLHEWFYLFWDMYSAQRSKTGNGVVNQYVNHTQQQSRLRQSHQQEMLRQMRPDAAMNAQNPAYQAQLMRNLQNGGMGMGAMNKGGLARAAMANNQNNPQAMQMLQQAKQNQMQRDPSDMDGNRQRQSSPGSADNAPSPSKRPRLGDAPFNANQAGMMPNGRPGQGMPGQQVGNAASMAQAQAQQLLVNNGINPASLTPQQFQQFSAQTPQGQQKSIATYTANLQQHHNQQMPNKQMANAAVAQGQGSPMMPGPDGAALATYYNAEMGGPAGLRAGPGGPQAGGSNHALQDYQMQLMLLEQQNKKRLMMARQEQDNVGTMPRSDQPNGPAVPGAPPGANGQAFPDTSPQGGRTGASPNPADQMKRGTPQMNNAGIPSPLPEGAQSRGSPNPMTFMGNDMNPNIAPHFYNKAGMDGNMANGPMNGMRPPSSHPGQTFNQQMNPQMMAAARQQAAAGAQGNPQAQWQAGPNGTPMMAQGPQGTPQQRSMPPPSGPTAVASGANNRNTSSPQQSTPQPPTPSQANKPAPKKKDTKNAKDKRAATQKKSNANLNAAATPAAEPTQEAEPPTPATPLTPANPAAGFKPGQVGSAPPPVPNGQQAPTAAAAASAAAPTASVGDPAHADSNGSFMDNNAGMVDFAGMDFTNPLTSDNVLNDFDFDSFLHGDDGDSAPFDFNSGFTMGGTGEIGAD